MMKEVTFTLLVLLMSLTLSSQTLLTKVVTNGDTLYCSSFNDLSTVVYFAELGKDTINYIDSLEHRVVISKEALNQRDSLISDFSIKVDLLEQKDSVTNDYLNARLADINMLYQENDKCDTNLILEKKKVRKQKRQKWIAITTTILGAASTWFFIKN